MNRPLKIAIVSLDGQVSNYVAAIQALGAEPVVITAICSAEPFDGLILPGGVDVDPARYHRENTASNIDPALDALQFAMLDRFVQLKKPVFGICRGHQVINVYFGGTLIQHITGDIEHARTPGKPVDKAHNSAAAPSSFLAQLYGTAFRVNSAHHQSIELPGQGLVIVQHAPDGVVEGAYHESLPVWSVQWHPERMCFAHRRDDTVDGSLVLRFFLDQCTAHKQTTGV